MQKFPRIQKRCALLENSIPYSYHYHKGLDFIPVLFEMVLWSAKYDPQSEAARIPELVKLIRKDNRSVSEKSAGKVRDGIPVVLEYLKRQS